MKSRAGSFDSHGSGRVLMQLAVLSLECQQAALTAACAHSVEHKRCEYQWQAGLCANVQKNPWHGRYAMELACETFRNTNFEDSSSIAFVLDKHECC